MYCRSGRSSCPFILFLRLFLEFGRCATAAVHAHVRFSPSSLYELVEGAETNLSLSAHIRGVESDFRNISDAPWKFDVTTFDSGVAIAKQVSSNYNYNRSSAFYTLEALYHVQAKKIGKSGIRARLVLAAWDETQDLPVLKDDDSSASVEIWVKRNPDSIWLTNIFVTTLILLISVANIMMGCEIDMSIVWSTVQRPVAPLIGFLCQFVVMPLLAYSIGRTLFVGQAESSFALGLFVAGSSPGGGASNFWTLLLDGNVNLSVTMTFLSTLASLVMMPFWFSMLGDDIVRGFSSSVKVRIPYTKIVSSLVALVVPLMIGVFIARWRPNLAAQFKKMLRPFVIFVLIFVIVFGCISNSYMWRLVTAKAALAGFLLPWCGFMCGCFVSLITRRDPRDVAAIAIETGIQNTGIAILVLKWSFPEPDSDISALIPVLVACFTPAPLLLGVVLHRFIRNRGTQDAKELDEKYVEIVFSPSTESLSLYPMEASEKLLT